MSYNLLFTLLKFIRPPLNGRIVPICIEFPFITSKLQDFNTYATVVEKIAQGQHLTTEGINQIVEFVSQKRKASNNNKDKIG